MAKIDVAEIDRDLLAVTWLRSELVYVLYHATPSVKHLYGWYEDGQSESRGVSSPKRNFVVPRIAAVARERHALLRVHRVDRPLRAGWSRLSRFPQGRHHGQAALEMPRKLGINGSSPPW